MSQYETVLFDVEGHVATIAINRPDVMNSFNAQLRQDLLSAMSSANSNAEVRVVILTGTGRAFSAGADLSAGDVSAGEGVTKQLEEEYRPVLMAMHESPKLYITAVNGAAAGAGSAFAMAGDLCIMADNAYLMEAFAGISLVPDCGATWFMVQQLGTRRALELILSGEKISAERCLELGLANRVVPADSLLDEAKAMASNFAEKAPLALQYSKQLVQEMYNCDLGAAFSREAQLQGICSASKDAAEGIAAFMQKRKPNFIGE